MISKYLTYLINKYCYIGKIIFAWPWCKLLRMIQLLWEKKSLAFISKNLTEKLSIWDLNTVLIVEFIVISFLVLHI